MQADNEDYIDFITCKLYATCYHQFFFLLRQRLTIWWRQSGNWQFFFLSLWYSSIIGICHQAWLYKIFIINFPMLPYSTFCCWEHYDLLAQQCSVPVVQDDFLSWFLLLSDSLFHPLTKCPGSSSERNSLQWNSCPMVCFQGKQTLSYGFYLLCSLFSVFAFQACS